VSLISIKITGEHYQQIKAIAEKARLSIRAVAERVIDEGLNTTERMGKVVVNNPDALAKVQKSLAQMRENQAEVLDRLDGLEEGEVVEDELDEPVPGKKLTLAVPSVRSEEVDGFRYYCQGCGALLPGDPEEDRPETCRDCGAKLDWTHLETSGKSKESSGSGGVILAGFLALLALSSLRGRAGNNQISTLAGY